MAIYDNLTTVSVPRKRIGDQLSHQEFNEILDALTGNNNISILCSNIGIKNSLLSEGKIEARGYISSPKLIGSNSIIGGNIQATNKATLRNCVVEYKTTTSSLEVLNGIQAKNILVSGNVTTGSLTTNIATVNNDLTVKNNLTVNNNLTTKNITVLENVTTGSLSTDTATVKNNLTVNNNLTVEKDATFNKNVVISETLSLRDLNALQNVSCGETLTVNGATTCNSTLKVTGASTLTGNVSCEGTLTVNDATNCNSTLKVTGASTLTGNVSCGETLTVNGATTLSSLSATSITASSGATITGNSKVTGDLEVTGNLTGNGAKNITDRIDALSEANNIISGKVNTAMTFLSGSSSTNPSITFNTGYVDYIKGDNTSLVEQSDLSLTSFITHLNNELQDISNLIKEMRQ